MSDNRILVNNKRKMFAIADMIEGEVNRMCVTDDLEELHRMCNWVIDNANLLKEIKESELNLQNIPCEDMTSNHEDIHIYNGCLNLMNKMLYCFYEYLDYIGVDIENQREDEKFLFTIPRTEIVGELFLQHTSHSGGTSCRMKCDEIGISRWGEEKFDFQKFIEDEED